MGIGGVVVHEVQVLEVIRVYLLLELRYLLLYIVHIRVVDRVNLIDQCRRNHVLVVKFHLLKFI